MNIGAALRRATRRARVELQQLSDTQIKRLQAAYQRALEQITADIAAAAGTDGRVHLERLQQLKAALDLRMAELSTAIDAGIVEGMRTAALSGASVVAAGGIPVRAMIAEDALRAAQSFVAADGLRLSDRIWRLGAAQLENVVRAIEQAIVSGYSADRAALDYIARGELLPRDIDAKRVASGVDALTRNAAGALTGKDAAAYRDALRLFRTELNRAHGMAYVLSLADVPDVAGVRFTLSPQHPRPDICDMHAAVNLHGLGSGVYPLNAHPWPAHPETLSFLQVVMDDEITPEDRNGKESRIDWLKRQAPVTQEAVLGSRKKRAALDAGMLKENQIATPWTKLKERYIRQGIDVDALGADQRPLGSSYRPAGGIPAKLTGSSDPAVLKIASHAINAITQVHGVPQTRSVNVVRNTLKEASDANGYMLPTGREIREIGLLVDGPNPELTFAHEFGHMLDFMSIGTRGAMASRTNSVMAGVRSAIDNSAATQWLEKLANQLPAGHAKNMVRDYLLATEEQWARAYAQYITLRSQDAVLRQQLDKLLLGFPRTQWAWDDFEPIAAAIDQLFLSLGWIR